MLAPNAAHCAPSRISPLDGAAWLLALAALGTPGAAFAFVYPEHRDIAVGAVEKLDPERRAEFDVLWHESRITQEKRLCEQAADPAQGVAPSCIDWAALAAIAGDHSCSSQDLTATVLESRWILSVADVAAQLKLDLSRIDVLPPTEQVPGGKDPIKDFQRRMQSEGARAARLNALRTADNRLQRADPQYATRAGSNNAHFLLPRASTGTTAREYALLAMKVGSEISAMGVYAWYHLSAMQKATRLANEQLAPDARKALTRAMLFDEAFALHFLEDMFAAGHVAGTWGDTSQRKGTHDFYNEAGLEAFPWKGSSESMVLMGDAHMRPEDVERASGAVRTSLEQLLDTAAGRSRDTKLPHTPAAPVQPDAFDVCKNNNLVARSEPPPAEPEAYWSAFAADLREVLRPTPVPGLGPGLGAMPRSRSEVGPFVGLSGVIDGRWMDGGFTPSQGGGFIGGVELAGRVGLGLDGVMGDAGDGLVFFSLGIRGDSASTNSISDSASAQQAGNLSAAIPARTGVATRLRMPFYLIPGDLVFLSPLYFISPERYQGMAVVAGNGGLIPWQSGLATKIGRFQFVLGRELGITFYGHIGEDRVLAPSVVPGGPLRVVDYDSILFDLPILEYRPYRSFASNQSSSVIFQLFTAADVPQSASVVAPAGSPTPDLDTIWSVGLRLVFDWRYYP
ncbi:MAG TPA: hypothetical protein VJT81_10435 [Burkholderiales bacterium]|nr:hypothetical protein [Burkholderiales bacterium]